MTALTQLVYVSRRKDHVTTDEVVDNIVLPAMRKNRRLNVTGCLWFGPRQFVQVLEGASPTIDSLYTTILADDRHDRVTLVNVSPIDERDFARFALKHIENDEIDEVRGLIDRFAPDNPTPARLPDDPLTGEDVSLIEAVVARLRAMVT
ncbi:MAG: BLUF domain-containing protein [Phycisphaerales bacterium JB059]